MNKEQMYVVRVANTPVPGGHTFLHSGGRGNGAAAGLYKQAGVNRVLGRYKKAKYLKAEAIPVVVGKTFEQEVQDCEQLTWLQCLEDAGVDNWSGIDYAHDLRKEMQDGEA